MMLTEFRRQGVPNSKWRLSDINQHYELCNTYPSVLAFPTSVSDEQLLSAAEFRSQRTCVLVCFRLGCLRAHGDHRCSFAVVAAQIDSQR
jgi:hypothetical protein